MGALICCSIISLFGLCGTRKAYN